MMRGMPFNTANEVASDILTKISITPENRSVLNAALGSNEVLGLALAVAEQLEGSHALLIATHENSIPSKNFAPRMTFGNWLWQSRRRQLFSAAQPDSQRRKGWRPAGASLKTA